MLPFNFYPYSDFHEMNLDWVIKQIMELHHDYDVFKAVNRITNAGAWDITKQYQAWTVVSDNNMGYISLQPVPAGIAITNPRYWGLIADYDILITNLSERISYLENLANDTRFICLGDSYGVDAQAGGKAWSSYVSDTYPDDAIISCIGGLSFISDVYLTPPDNYLTVLQALNVSDPEYIKSIFIFGGANDANLYLAGTVTLSDIKDRIKSFCSYVKTNFPNATVYIGWIGWYKAANHADAYCATRDLYMEACSEIDNAVYIAGLEPIMRNVDYINSNDQVHPVFDASATLGEYINLAIATKSDVHYHKEFTTNFTKSTYITNLLDIAPQRAVTYDGYNVTLKVFGTKNNYHHLDLRLPNSTISEGASLLIGRFSNAPGGEGLPICSYMPILILDGSVLKSANARFELDNTTGDLRMYMLDDVTYSNVVEILIPSPLIVSGMLR